MNRQLFLLTSIFFFAITADAEYYVGSWTSNLTPKGNETESSCLGGYGIPFSRCGNTTVLDPITVRSLSISDNDTDVIIAVIDTIGVGDSIISDIKELVFNLTYGHIAKESIQIVATHSHSGPDLQGIWGGISPSYRERIIKKTTLSILLAYFTAEKARISVKTIEDGAEVSNRRGWEVVDSRINVLDIKAKNTDRRIATLVNMSAHPTVLDETNNAYSAGYIHFVRKKIEKRLGGNAIFINGIVGDAAPVTNGTRTYKEAKKYGKKIARKVIRNINKARIVSGDFSLETYNFSHQVNNTAVLGAVQTGLLDLQIDENYNVNTQFSLMSFGSDLTAVLFPGEILTRLAIPLLSAIQSEHKLFFGLTDDSLGYFIPSDEFLMIQGRDTEERASLDVLIGDQIQAAILNEIE